MQLSVAVIALTSTFVWTPKGSGGNGVGLGVVVVDTPGLRDNTDLIAVGRRRKGSKSPSASRDGDRLPLYNGKSKEIALNESLAIRQTEYMK